MNLFAWYWLAVVVFSLLYLLLIIWYLIGWQSIKVYKNTKVDFTTTISIILPYYNEAPNLPSVVRQVTSQAIRTKNIELLLIDDYSTDNSYDIAKELADNYQMVSCLKNRFDNGKKQALQYGIDQCSGELIVTIDADVELGINWLNHLVSYYEEFKPNLIIAPVKTGPVKGLFQSFQFMDTMSLVASGAGAAGINRPIMCNGANLAYSREAFLQIKDPFNSKYLSGDDVFLLHAFKKLDSNAIHFLKSQEAFATVEPTNSISSFVKQRRRWASKTKGYTDNDAKFVAVVVYITSFLLVMGGFAVWFNSALLFPLLFIFGVKTMVDILFFNATSNFFKAEKLVKWVPVFQLFYVLYVGIVGILAQLPQKKWQ